MSLTAYRPKNSPIILINTNVEISDVSKRLQRLHQSLVVGFKPFDFLAIEIDQGLNKFVLRRYLILEVLYHCLGVLAGDEKCSIDARCCHQLVAWGRGGAGVPSVAQFLVENRACLHCELFPRSCAALI